MNKLLGLFGLIVLVFSACEPNVPNADPIYTLSQKLTIYNFRTSLDEGSELYYTRDTSDTIGPIAFASSKMTYYQFSDTLVGETKYSKIHLYNQQMSEIAEKEFGLVNQSNYSFFVFSSMPGSAQESVDMIALSDLGTVSNEHCNLNFLNFNVKYDTLFFYLNSQLVARVPYGESSPTMQFVPNVKDTLAITTSLNSTGFVFYDDNMKGFTKINNYYVVYSHMYSTQTESNALYLLPQENY